MRGVVFHGVRIGVYPETADRFPIGQAMMKNPSLHRDNCNHRTYSPKLIEMVRTGIFEPRRILSRIEPVTGALEAYKKLYERQPEWLKVELIPAV